MRNIKLSPQERTVIYAAADGKMDHEVAAALGVAPATVRTYWARINAKLRSENRTHAVAIVLKNDCYELHGVPTEEPPLPMGEGASY